MSRTENKVYYDSEDPEGSVFRINEFPGGKKMLKNVTGFMRIRDLSGELRYDIINGKFIINNPLTGREDEYDIPIILEKEQDLVLSRSYARFNYNSIKKIIDDIENKSYFNRKDLKGETMLSDETRKVEKWRLTCGEFSTFAYSFYDEHVYFEEDVPRISLKWTNEEDFDSDVALVMVSQKPVVQGPQVLNAYDESTNVQPVGMSKDGNRLDVAQKVIEITKEPHRETLQEATKSELMEMMREAKENWRVKVEQKDLHEEEYKQGCSQPKSPSLPPKNYTQIIKQVPGFEAEITPEGNIKYTRKCSLPEPKSDMDAEPEDFREELLRDCYETASLMTFNPKTHRMEKMSYAEFLKMMNKKK